MPIIPPAGTGLGCQGAYQWQDVVTVAQNLVHSIPVAALQIYACDQINSIVHGYFPWRWTLFGIPPITATDGTQDYASVPNDFFRLVAARLIRTDVTPNQYQPIKIANHLEVEVQRRGSINTVQSISYEPQINSFRLDIPLQVSGTTVYQITGDYQLKPTKVTVLSQLICPPDQYFNVLVEGVLWQFYRLADDPRTGSASINRPGDKQAQGQFGIFSQALEDMKRSEDYGEAIDSRYPESPLGWVRTGNPGIFPTV